MTSLLLDALFTPPVLKTGDRVTRKQHGISGFQGGTVVSFGGWFAVIRWDGNPSLRREYIPDLQMEES